MKLLLILGSAIALPSFAAGGGDLDIGDSVGVSFWLVTAAMLAATVFFFVERDQVSSKSVSYTHLTLPTICSV